MPEIPDDVRVGDLEDLYSPWRTVTAALLMVLGIVALVNYPPIGLGAVGSWYYILAGMAIGLGMGLTEHIVQLEERRFWQWFKRKAWEVVG